LNLKGRQLRLLLQAHGLPDRVLDQRVQGYAASGCGKRRFSVEFDSNSHVE
jgi:hypothetical protein